MSPVLDPLLPNSVGLFDEQVARALCMVDYDDDAGVEFSLGVINIGQARAQHGYHILDRRLYTLGPECRVSVCILPDL
jgi:hypothetical protein